MGALLTRATLRGSLRQIHHVPPVHPRAARGLVAEVYDQVRRDFGMLAPPVVLHAPAPVTLAAVWLMLREALLVNDRASRARKETVAAAVSARNACPYCVEVHGAALRGLVRGRHAAAIAAGTPDAVGDPDLRAVAGWAHAGGTRGTAVRVPEPAAELVAVALVFEYLNRMVNVFLDTSPMPARLPATLHDGVAQAMGWLMAPIGRRVRSPGAALSLLPDAPVPGELSWAAQSPRIRAAFARAYAAVDAADLDAVPPGVRAAVELRLSTWDGEPVDRGWIEDTVRRLDESDRPAARLALLTAFASYRVGPSVVEAYRRTGAGDATLIELTAWAALVTARRIGDWLDPRIVADPLYIHEHERHDRA